MGSLLVFKDLSSLSGVQSAVLIMEFNLFGVPTLSLPMACKPLKSDTYFGVYNVDRKLETAHWKLLTISRGGAQLRKCGPHFNVKNIFAIGHQILTFFGAQQLVIRRT